jgi:hypothetical protein
VKRENWIARFETLSDETNGRFFAMKKTLAIETDVYRRQYRAPKR